MDYLRIKIFTLAALLVAGAAMTFTACSSSSDDIIDQPVNPTDPQAYTMTVQATKGGDAATRGLDYNAETKTLNVKWNTDEEVKVYAVLYQNYELLGTLSPVTASDNETVTLKGTLTGNPSGKDLAFFLNGDPNSDMTFNYEGQTGVLLNDANSIEKKYDHALGIVTNGNFTVSGSNITVPGGITFNSYQAIVKFNFVDTETNNPIIAKSLKIETHYLVSSYNFSSPTSSSFGPMTITPTPATNEFYAALYHMSSDNTDFILTVTDTDDITYTYKKHTKFVNGQYYAITVKMTKPRAAAKATVTDVGKVIGANGNIYKNAGAATAAGTTAVAMIAYVGSETCENSPYNHGLALALSDAGGKCQWSTSDTKTHEYNTSIYFFEIESGLQYNDAIHNSDTYPPFKAAMSNNGTAVPIGCSAWFLPTGRQWNNMINAAGGYTALRSSFESVGGNNLVLEYTHGYWSATENCATHALAIDFYYGEWGCNEKTWNCPVRSALAF